MKSIRDYPLTIIHEIPPVLSSKDKCAIDTELFQMDKDRLHRPILPNGEPNGFFACATFCWDGETVYFVTNENDVQEAMDNVKDAVWIFANLKFDIVHLRRHANIPVREDKMWDVISMERILWSGYYSNFSLADLTRRRLRAHLPKEDRKTFATATGLSPERERYAAYDPIATWHVYQDQRKDVLKRREAITTWAEEDLPALNTVMSMKGFKMNGDSWNIIADEAEAKRKIILEKWEGILLTSSQQVGAELVRQGYTKLPKTPTGRPKTDIDTLSAIKDPNEFVSDLITFSATKSQVGTYGRAFSDTIEPDGRVYADFKPLGAKTGRFSCSGPNMQNIPNKYTDPRYRECLIAEDGNILIIADYSSQEPRIGAYITQDRELLRIFDEDLDIYIESARLMMGWEITKEDPRRNNPIKPTVLGAFFGLTEHGLEKGKDKIPKEEGRKLLDAFFFAFSGVANWISGQRKRKDFVETITGRKFWLNPYNWQSKNNAINSPVQGSAADMMKRAGWRFVKAWGNTLHSPIVNFVHDEIVLEVPLEEKDRAIRLLAHSMVSVAEEMHPGVRAKADVGVGKTWNAKA